MFFHILHSSYMMATFTAKTVDAAIEQGLQALQIDRKQAEIQVIQVNRKGFLCFGRRDAIVEVKSAINNKPTSESMPMEQPPVAKHSITDKEARLAKQKMANKHALQQLMDYLAPIIAEMGIEVEMQPKLVNRKLAKINFETNQEGLLIGKYGLTINALQELSQIYLNHIGFSRLNIQLDTADYRHRRTEILKKLAEKTAREAVATGQPVYLDPMPSFERKVIHNQLENNIYVNTFSSGREPYRAVVIEPENG
jgi:spoIIIJ-associated protein